MALTDFYIKQNDTLEAIVIICEDFNGDPITRSLDGASVEFHLRSASGTLLVAAGTGQVISDDDKTIGYQWVEGDTAVSSANVNTPHQAEFQVTYSDGNVETFPNNQNLNVHTFPEVA